MMTSLRNNNRLVWIAMRAMFHGTEAYPYIRQFEPTMNGRGAYYAITGHYLGTSFEVVIRSKAETYIRNARFTGRNKKYPLEKFLSELTDAFNDLPSAETPPVRRFNTLIQALQCKELDATKQALLANPHFRDDYQAATDLVSENWQRIQNTNNTTIVREVGATESGNKRGKKRTRDNDGDDGNADQDDGNEDKYDGEEKGYNDQDYDEDGDQGDSSDIFDPKNPGRYYPRHEWEQLTREQRRLCWEAREQGEAEGQEEEPANQPNNQSNAQPNQQGNQDNQQNNQMAAYAMHVAAYTQALQQMQAQQQGRQQVQIRAMQQLPMIPFRFPPIFPNVGGNQQS